MNSINLTFGGKDYEVPQLSAIKSRAWRESLISSARLLAQSLFKETNGHDEEFFAGLGISYLAFPDKLAELIFAYAPQLPREEILLRATDDELIVAFSSLMKAAFPYVKHLSLLASFDVSAELERMLTE